MNLRRAYYVFGRELRLSPRSPIVFFAIAIPLLMTFLISAVFGTLFESTPRLGIVDEGQSQVTVAAQELEGIEVTIVEDEAMLRRMVEDHDVDAGLVLQPGFDEAITDGRQPDLLFFVSGDSLASNRVILAVTTIDLVRGVAGEEPPVAVVVTPIGDENYVPVGDRLIPSIVLYAVLIAALFVPAASLVDEREKRTIDAVLVTPTRMNEVLLGKASFAILLSVIMGLVTLALNSAFAGQFWAMVTILFIGSLMMALVGLLLGLWSKDITSLYTAVKAGGFLIFLPAIFMLFPGLPQWIPRFVPTYYFLQPVFDIAIGGDGFLDVLPNLLIALAICIALVPLVAQMARRAEHELAITV